MTTDIINSIEGLKNNPSLKITPEIWGELTQKFRMKYGVDLEDSDVFNISRKELDELKSEIERSKDLKATIEKHLYEEVVETRLEKHGAKAVNFDIVTAGIESPRIDDLRREFEKFVSPLLEQYDFLDENTKNLLKLSIANKLLSNPASSELQSGIKSVGKFIQKFDTNEIGEPDTIKDDVKKVAKKSQEEFEPIIKAYILSLDTFKKEFESRGISDATNKQAIISNIEWFKNPNLIEGGPLNEAQIKKVDFTKTTFNDKFDVELIKNYVLNSRRNINNLSVLFNEGDKTAEAIYTLAGGGEFMNDSILGFTKMLLEIPFIGKFIAIFLGLDPENAAFELEENSKNYKLFKTLKGLGKSVGEKGKKVEGKGTFKNTDLSSLTFNSLKGEIKEIKNNFPDLKEEEYEKFFTQAFSEEGYDVKGYKFKFELSQNQSGKTKLGNADFKDILKNGLDKYDEFKKSEDKKAKEQERIEKESKVAEAQQKTKSALERLDLSISAIDRILSGGYKDIPNWNSWLNDNDVNVANILEIVEVKGDNFDDVIKKAVGESNFEDIKNAKYLPFLNDFFALIREYFKDKKPEEIFSGTLEEFMDSDNFKKGFIEFLQSKKTGIQSKREETSHKVQELSKEQSEIAFKNKIFDKIKSLGDGVKLSEGFELYDSKIIKFDKGTQKLQIGDKYYPIVLKHNGEVVKISDISTLNGKVNFELDDVFKSTSLKAMRIKNPDKGLIDKEIITAGIIELITKDKFNYLNLDDNIDLKIGE